MVTLKPLDDSKKKKKKDVSPNSDTTSQKFTMETTVSIKLLQRPLKV